MKQNKDERRRAAGNIITKTKEQVNGKEDIRTKKDKIIIKTKYGVPTKTTREENVNNKAVWGNKKT